VDARTAELRAAHDVLAEFYAERLSGALERMPGDRAVLGPFCELVLAAGIGPRVADIGCAFDELARVVAPGGYVVTAFKAGAGELRRGGRTTGLGIEFDLYYLSPAEMEQRLGDAGFTPVFWGGRPAEEGENSPQAFLVARRA
jgi:hypothetical protein